MPSSIANFVQRSRQKTLDREPSADAFSNRYFSGTTYSLWRAARGVTARYSTGLVLDAGSGRGAWKSIITRNAVRESVDIEPKVGEQVTWIADLTDMPQVPSARYDTVVCHQVLEHVPDPAAAMSELLRVLKPGGHLVISVPHLSRQHELPHDYFRFTPNGLDRLMRQAGFEVVSVGPFGGLMSFVHHQLATALLGLSAIFRPLHLLCVALNAPLSYLSAQFDRLSDRQGFLAVGVIAVGQKPVASLSKRGVRT